MTEIQDGIALQLAHPSVLSSLNLLTDAVLVASCEQSVVQLLSLVEQLPVYESIPNGIDIVIVQQRLEGFQSCGISLWESSIRQNKRI